MLPPFLIFFFFNDPPTTEIYTLSLHGRSSDLLPAAGPGVPAEQRLAVHPGRPGPAHARASAQGDRKSTRLNSSHSQISYAVFCLKKKKKRRDMHPADRNDDHHPN